MERLKIAIVGAGSAGLFSAFYLSRLSESVEVHVYEQDKPGAGASSAAAGMLAPLNELEFQEIALHEAGRKSLSMYLTDIEPALGEIGLKRKGSLEVGLHADDAGYLRRLFQFQTQLGLPVEWLNGDALQDVEPLLSKSIQNGILAHEDMQVDNLKLIDRLLAYLRSKGVQFHFPCRVLGWEMQGGKVKLEFEGGNEVFDQLLSCVGAMDLGKIALPQKIYPVRGEMIALKPISGSSPESIVRIRSKVLGPAYVVPKEGRILCGSTSEEKGHKKAITAGGMLDILRKCHLALPCIYEMEIIETWSGLRPATLSRNPFLEKEPGIPVFHLNGLFRHGILLGPLMGKSAAAWMLGGQKLPEVLALHPKGLNQHHD
jgi:glycine oxidase